jgi:surfeit locus 1 family protein
LTIAAAIVFAICCGLGVWQLQRKAEKTRDLARLASLSHAPASPLVDALTALAAGHDETFVHVTAICAGLDKAPFAELYAVVDGRPGVRLISACRVADGRYGGVLVDRGFIDDAVKTRPPVDKASIDPTPVSGVLRRPSPRNAFTPKRVSTQPLWFWRDVPGMARMLDLNNPAPLMLISETASNPDQSELRPAPLSGDEGANSRKGEYALTWFGLALVLACFYAAMLTKWLRQGVKV